MLTEPVAVGDGVIAVVVVATLSLLAIFASSVFFPQEDTIVPKSTTAKMIIRYCFIGVSKVCVLTKEVNVTNIQGKMVLRVKSDNYKYPPYYQYEGTGMESHS
jgi:hypothetical protein